jgi:hypothetical protein
MTKLEELKAEAEAADTAASDAIDACDAAEAECNDAWSDYEAARAARNAAWVAYEAELMKIQKENTDGH